MKLYKTKPFKHQLKALALSKDAEVYALLMEQGTGKSKVVIDTAAHLWRTRKIDSLLIITPKGVAPGWLLQQLPEHMPEDVEYRAALWRTTLPKYKQRLVAEACQSAGRLRIIVMNIEAFGASKKAIDFAIEFLDAAQSALVVVDESHRIKSHGISTSKRILNLRIRCAYRRILTGTVADKPFDVFSQYGFLDPAILGTDSFTAFKSEYAEMLPDTSGLMRHIAMRVPKVWKGRYVDSLDDSVTDSPRGADGVPNKKHMEPRYLPQIVATNADGTPRYRNLDKLHALTAPHSYRVLKADCLDLPDKIYTRYYTELDDGRQRELYEQVRDTARIEWESGAVSTFNKLTVYLRLQQIICGYIPDETRTLRNLFPSWKENPRILSALELIEDRPAGEPAIIWCRFVEDIKRVSEALRESYGAGSVVQFYGDVGEEDRAEAVARFEGVRTVTGKSGKVLRVETVVPGERARFMLAQQRAGGVGQTWVAAGMALYYSNSFSYIDRIQSEDRCHRIGQRKVVQYVDLEAEETVDSKIIGALIAKKSIADVINGDKSGEWLG